MKVVRLLLEANCDADLRDRYGETALMLAARKGNLEIMQVDEFKVRQADEFKVRQLYVRTKLKYVGILRSYGCQSLTW